MPREGLGEFEQTVMLAVVHLNHGKAPAYGVTIVDEYQFEKGKYALIEEEDIEKVRPPSTRVINIMQFADASVIDPVYVERPYYLGPDGQVAADAFAVMRESMAGKAAVGKLALYGREYLVAIAPRENGFVM